MVTQLKGLSSKFIRDDKRVAVRYSPGKTTSSILISPVTSIGFFLLTSSIPKCVTLVISNAFGFQPHLAESVVSFVSSNPLVLTINDNVAQPNLLSDALLVVLVSLPLQRQGPHAVSFQPPLAYLPVSSLK